MLYVTSISSKARDVKLTFHFAVVFLFGGAGAGSNVLIWCKSTGFTQWDLTLQICRIILVIIITRKEKGENNGAFHGVTPFAGVHGIGVDAKVHAMMTNGAWPFDK